MNSNGSLLQLKGVSKRFGPVQALNNVDFEVKAGEVAGARSLLGEPKLVLLDEPTAALGVSQTAQVLALIKRLKERGLGVVVISHNLADVFQVTDRIFVLRLGQKAGDFDAEHTTQEHVVGAITGAQFGDRPAPDQGSEGER